MGQIAIAILAAGRGSRFGGDRPKPLALLGGRSLVSMALSAAVDSSLAPVLLVVGYGDDQVAAVAPPSVRVVRNPGWQQGIASSLQAALRALEPEGSIEALCVGLAGQPLVGADSYPRLAAAYREGASIAVATYEGARRNPVLLACSIWQDAMKLEGDEGARQLMKIHPVVEVDCDRTGNPLDVDTQDDIQLLETNILPTTRLVDKKEIFS